MSPYVITNPDGVIVGAGIVHEESADQIVPPGCTLHFGVQTVLGGTIKRLIDGQVVDTGESIIPTTYQTQRRSAYPAIEDQMDMLWHAMHRGDAVKVEPFYSEILAVKQQYPKPSN